MKKDFNVLDFFFDWNGRIGRQDFWLGTIALFIFQFPMIIFTFSMILGSLFGGSGGGYIFSTLLPYMASVLIFFAITFFAQLVLYIKRMHDREKSGHFVWIMLVPYIGPFWLLIEAGFLKGTKGNNEYGEDPLELI